MRNTIISFRQLGCIERNIDFQNLPEHQTRLSKHHHDQCKLWKLFEYEFTARLSHTYYYRTHAYI